MATSGSFTGNRGTSNSTSPRLILDWNRIETDIAGNRSKIRLTLKLDVDGRVNFSANKTGKLHGSSFTYTGGVSGSNLTRTLHTRDVWVSHNADGTKSQTFSATFNIDLTFSGVKINSLSVSGTANIDAIPRASGLTAFSLNSTSIAYNTARTINYTLDRKSGSFTHDISLRLGNRTIKSWTDSGTGARTQSLTASNANDILKALPKSTSGTLTLRVQTKSGKTNIGSAATRTVKISVASSVSPTASGITTSIYGSGRDKTIGKYVQSITRVTSSFTRSAGYGASISSSSIVIRRVSGGANSQTISGNSGTTANPVSLNGTYEAIGTVRDSRGRTATSRTTFTVESYSAPRITKFTASRNGTNPATVNITRAGTWSSIGTGSASLNNLTILIQKRVRTSSTWSNVQSTTGNTGTFSGNVNATGNSEAKTYQFRITITDSFNNKASSTVDIGTSFQELTISRGKGIGVGKVHEKGVIDINGKTYIEDNGEVLGVTYRDHGYLSWYKGNEREAYIGKANGTNDWITIRNEINDQSGSIFLGKHSLDLRNVTMFYNNHPVYTPGNRVLWSGILYMTGNHNVFPSKTLAQCPNGWILVWGNYTNGVAEEQNFNFTVIHKQFVVEHHGRGINCIIGNVSNVFRKYIYVNSDRLIGHDMNIQSPANNQVLREVLEF